MDEFGVLVESIGFKAQGQSAPLATLKSQPKQPNYHNGFPQNIAPPSKPLNNDPFFVDDLDGIFRSNTNNITKSSQNSHDFFGGNDVFGGPFSNSKPSGAAGGIGLDDLFVGNSSSKGSTTLYDDLLGTMSKNDDIFGLNSNNSRMNLEKNGNGFDDLIPGFGQSNKGANSATGRSPSNLGSPSAEDPLSVFESFVSHQNTSSWPFSETSEQSAGKSSSSIDELEDFAMGRSQSNANERSDVKISKEAMTRVQEKLRNMKDFGDKQNAVPDGKIKVPFPNKDVRKSRGTPETKVEKTSPQASHSTKKAPSSSNYFDDFSFFGEPAPSAVEFQEIDGEPEERRRARLNTHMKTKERMAKALEEKNQRDLQAQREQEEKRRLAETLDADIKQWAAGKEGNLRALLSSMQYVLWPECGWQPVSLTDLITSTSVKKVYLKATLYVHPDKVQQKGAKQKYIAERVFDVLKEAWNKFNAEELR